MLNYSKGYLTITLRAKISLIFVPNSIKNSHLHGSNLKLSALKYEKSLSLKVSSTVFSSPALLASA
jgi:hypothetical protein